MLCKNCEEIKCEKCGQVIEEKKSLLPMPADNEEFELTLEGDLPENHPLAMLKCYGYDDGWKHKGPTVSGTQTHRFEWVTVGYQPNLDAVKKALEDQHYKIPGGQWLNAVIATYANNGVPRGIADPSWGDPDRHAYFPYVCSNGYAHFVWADNGLSEFWRWLVESH